MDQKVALTVQDTATMVWSYVPSLVGALAILAIGWVVSALVARGARAGVEKTNLVGNVTKFVKDFEASDIRKMEFWVGRSVFIVLMLFVLIGFFQVLGLNQITQPITGFLNEIFEYLPRLIGPIVLVLIAWVVAKFLRLATRRVMESTKLDETLEKNANLTGDDRLSVTTTAGEAVYWLTFLVFLPAVLSSLDLGGLLGPVRSVVDKLLGYVPNLFAAGLILALGWLAARIIRKLVTNVLQSVGADNLSERVGLHTTLGKQSISNLVGLIVYVMVFIPIVVAALNALELNAITQPASRMLDEILAALPDLFAGALVLVVAYFVAKIVGNLSAGLLAGIGFDSLPARLGISSEKGTLERSPSTVAGYVLTVAIILFASVEALNLIGFGSAANLITNFLVFAGHAVLGLFIIGLGLFLAKFVSDVIGKTKIPNAAILALLSRVAILILATAMGLGEMGLAEEIISLAFGLTLGSVAVALAVAFGIGGRDIAANAISKWTNDNKAGAVKKPKET